MELQPRITGDVPFMMKANRVVLLALGAWLMSSAQAFAALSFATQQTFATGSGPHSVAAADLNADGLIDLVVCNQHEGTVSVLLNTTMPGATTPTFATQQAFTVGTNPVAAAIADIDGDGQPDLIVANASSGTLSILRNTTAAGATAPSFDDQQTFATGSYPYSVAATDLDGDGKLDLAVANVGSGTLSLLRNTTAAGATTLTFDAQQLIRVGTEPASVAVADFNADGRPDLVVADFIVGQASVLLNTTAAGAAAFSFADKQDLATDVSPVSVATGDFNGDGKRDAVVANSFTYTASVFINSTAAGAATATFSPAQASELGVVPASVAVADVNGDGMPDLISANQGGVGLSVLINTTATGSATPSFAAAQTFATGIGPVAVAAADVNGDGKPDLITANNSDSTLSVLLNTTAFAGANPDQHGITGSWFNPTTNGQGLEIELYPDLNGAGSGLLFGGWFTFDVAAAGGQRWYVLSGAVSSASPTAQLGIYAGIGGNFAAAPAVAATQVGTATLTFTSCNTGTLSYSFYDGRVGTIPLLRLTANITCGASGDNGAAASSYLLSGSWYQSGLDGQGLIFDVNPTQNSFFAAWYTYAPNGQQTGGAASERWYVIQAAFTPGDKTITDAPIYAGSGGVFDNATAPTSSPVGTATITYQSCSAATLTYSFTAGANAGLSGTLNLTRTGPTPAGCTL